MSNVLKISEAASLALHAVVFLAANPEERPSTGEVASILNASEAHLSKVLQRLAKVGLVKSLRGPKGGFVLGKRCDETTLLEVYEAIEGPLTSSNCLLSTPICRGKKCILGGLLRAVNKQVRGYLARTRLSELTNVYRGRSGERARRKSRSGKEP